MEVDSSKILETLRRRALELREYEVESMYCHYFLPFVSSLCLYLKSRADRPASLTEQSFIVDLIEVCIKRYLKGPPKEPTNWRKDLKIRCNCQDCYLLQRFVRDRHKKAMDFRMAEQRRKHIEYKLDYTFRKITIKTGTPYTLRVEKKNDKYDVDLQTWEKRKVSTRSDLSSLKRNSHLVDIIGEDSYKRLRRYDCLKSSIADSNPAPPSSLRPAPEQGLNVASIPKKRSFIDLTDS
jgi:hypothetical protein